MSEEYSRLVSDDEDQYEVYDMKDLEVVKSEKAVTASVTAITNFQINPIKEVAFDKAENTEL